MYHHTTHIMIFNNTAFFQTVFGPLVGAIEEVCARFHVVARFNSLHSEPWIRISCNVYNSIEDYEQLAEIVLQMSNESE